MSDRRPIDRAAVGAHAAPIWFPITHARELTTEFLDARRVSPERLVTTLIAAASVPALAEPVELDSVPLIDGACGSPLPLTEVIQQGYSDVVVVLNLPRGVEPAWYEASAMRVLAPRRGLPYRIVDVIQRARRTRYEAMRRIERGVPGVSFSVFAPSVHPGRTLERDPQVLQRAIDAGIALGHDTLHRVRAALAGSSRLGG